MVHHGIDFDSRRFKEVCQRRRIKELFVFGSVLREDFRPDSDVDFVVKLQERSLVSMRDLIGIEEELASIVGRPVDIVLGSELDGPEANPYRRHEVVSTMERIYDG